jgi:hypothetical protein
MHREKCYAMIFFEVKCVGLIDGNSFDKVAYDLFCCDVIRVICSGVISIDVKSDVLMEGCCDAVIAVDMH